MHRHSARSGELGCLAIGLLILVVAVLPLEYFVVWFAWDVHYEEVARSHGLLTESDFRSNIDRAARRTMLVLVAVQVMVLLCVWRRMRGPSASGHDHDAAT